MKKILVVDDFPLMVSVLSELLHREGHQVIEADRAEDGVLMAHREQPDLVLMDINTKSEIDGVEATRRIKKSDGQIKIIVFGIDGWPGSPLGLQAEEAGADAVVRKSPTAKDELIETVRKILG